LRKRGKISAMKTSFATYYKTILQKVSFDRQLFKKEYKKALQSISQDEVDDFNQWMRQNQPLT